MQPPKHQIFSEDEDEEPHLLPLPKDRGTRPDPLISIRGLSPGATRKLQEFVRATTARERLYWLVIALIRHHSVRTANAMAFDLFLALVPMLGLAGWMISHLFSENPAALANGSVLLDLTPKQLHGFLSQHLGALSAQSLAPLALGVGWWMSSSAFYTMMCVFEETFECVPRPWLRGRSVSLGFALVGMVLFVLAGFSAFFFTMEELGLVEALFGSDTARRLLHVVFLGGTAVALVLFLAFLYRYSIRRPGSDRHVWSGALLATLLGSIASVGLGYYASNIARYALFYGGLAAVVVLMLWLWLWCSAVILGAELNIALENLDEYARSKARASRVEIDELD